MKNLYFVATAFLMLSCNKLSKNELLVGEWELISMTDLRTLEISKPTSNDPQTTISIDNDSLFVKIQNEKYDTYRWSIKDDSLNLTTSFNSIIRLHLKTLDADMLDVEVNEFLMDSVVLGFKRLDH